VGHTGPRPLLPRGPGSSLHRTPRSPVTRTTGRYGSLPASPGFPKPRALGTAPPMGCVVAPHPRHPPGVERPRAEPRTRAPGNGEHVRERRGTPFAHRVHSPVAPGRASPGVNCCRPDPASLGWLIAPAGPGCQPAGLCHPPAIALDGGVHQPPGIPGVSLLHPRGLRGVSGYKCVGQRL